MLKDSIKGIFMKSLPPIESLWKERGFQPTDNQKRAIEHVDGPLLLTAGPGCGKTSVLLWRTVNLIAYHGVKPQESYLWTFTKRPPRTLPRYPGKVCVHPGPSL